MEYNMHFTFREEWVDERLLFYSDTLPHIVLSPEQKIWLPDTFFQNEKDGKKHDIDSPNILIRVHNSTAKILYSCRSVLFNSRTTLLSPLGHLAKLNLSRNDVYRKLLTSSRIRHDAYCDQYI